MLRQTEHTSSFGNSRDLIREELLHSTSDTLRDGGTFHADLDLNPKSVELQAIKDIFGDEYVEHTLEQAISTVMCGRYGHLFVERLMAARDVMLEAEKLDMACRPTDNGHLIKCTRCQNWYKL